MSNSQLTPRQAQELLAQHGMKVSLEQAEEMLTYMDMLAEVIVADFIKQKSMEKSENFNDAGDRLSGGSKE
ncbi:hypothetical protein DCC81_17925 [Chitinophaga parva]|uniref:Uncharacterized protein n=1 Tax=Chitinophaga parva TaxID=2169414 RepID=A0A2T7BIK8_9BACT|nr:hypothetical protein [Chitinophaga parva]PUZ26117.1 hypothetical protein DCC81_17925 [Chitinophaga parva]